MDTFTTPASSRPLVWRFAWKEYRMLRGFWLASAIIALLIQLLVGWSSLQSQQDVANAMFMVAWAGAALYVVGAAITMFAAETEERTRDYLRLLPGDWIPIFGTKVAMALVSAVLLGMFLSLTGWCLSDRPLQGPGLQILGVAGVTVVEFLAWGLLFSLWWKHPLLAAVAAIAAASFGAQWAIFGTTDANNSWTGEAYVEAVPGRLAICLIVFAVDVWLGRRWLYPVPTERRGITAKPTSGLVTVIRKADRPRLKMFSRLIWQTWRESWKAILVAVPLSFGLITAFMAPASLFFRVNEEYALWSMALFLPAIVGALVFRADQQKDHRLFLATHVAWPRYVWLARHVVWLGTVLLLGMVATLGVIYLFQMRSGRVLLDELGYYERNLRFYSINSMATEIGRAWNQLRSGTITAWCAVISAYAVGQLCSILLKQTVLSGFAALLLSVVLAAWSILMFAWQMNPWWFVLPIGIGAMLATWLRVPSWILQQNQWKHFVTPAMAVALPLTLAVAYVPTARMAQIEDIELPAYHYLREPLEVSVQEYKGRLKAQEQSLLKLETLGIVEEPWIEDVVLDGKTLADYDLSERALEFYGPGGYVGYYGDVNEVLDPTEVEILDRFEQEATRQALEANRAKIPELLAIVNSPEFEPLYGGRYLLRDRYSVDRLLGEFATLLANDAKLLSVIGDLDDAWQRLRAIPLIDPQFWYSERRFDFYEEVITWAVHPDQTSERQKHAIADLQQVFARLPRPQDKILENREFVRRVVLGERLPRYSNYNRVYFFLNQLPGEKARALTALDLLTSQALNQIDAVTALAVGEGPQLGVGPVENVGDLLRAWHREVLAEVYDELSKEQIQELRQAFATSFLAESEFDYGGDPVSLASNWVAEETRLRGLLLQLALMAYRLDHNDYPESFAELVPEYLREPITDPFSGQAFVYRPEGLLHRLVATNFSREDLSFIAEGTPLIWSVGYDSMQLAEAEPMMSIVKRYGGPQSVDEELLAAAEAGELYHYFRGTQRGGSNRFVFPLPKIEFPDEQPAK